MVTSDIKLTKKQKTPGKHEIIKLPKWVELQKLLDLKSYWYLIKNEKP